VIASSPSDVQPVFEAIVRQRQKLIGGFFRPWCTASSATISIWLLSTPDKPGGRCRLTGVIPDTNFATSDFPAGSRRRDGGICRYGSGRSAHSTGTLARLRGYRSMLFHAFDEQRSADRDDSASRAKETGSFRRPSCRVGRTFADQRDRIKYRRSDEVERDHDSEYETRRHRRRTEGLSAHLSNHKPDCSIRSLPSCFKLSGP